MTDLAQQFGGIDIYLFDQLLRGRLRPGLRWRGRNLVYLLREGFNVWAPTPAPTPSCGARAGRVARAIPSGRSRARGERGAQLVRRRQLRLRHSSAVLHFARDDAHFEAMVAELWRVLAPGASFARLASTAGLGAIQPLGDSRFRSPDGSIATW
ncbi:MAG: hypothetical protein R2712_26520 [Vicinamibacterales bacterium]